MARCRTRKQQRQCVSPSTPSYDYSPQSGGRSANTVRAEVLDLFPAIFASSLPLPKTDRPAGDR
jgi:hypothetical protein